jgi:DNA polymerase III delta prime subunit
MAVSVRVSEEGLKKVDQARKLKGWEALACAWYSKANTTQATLKRFRERKFILQDTFISICKAVGVDWQEVVESNAIPSEKASNQSKMTHTDFFAYDQYWVGRKDLIDELGKKLRNSCRMLILLGITGIGKTALAEKLAEELQDWFAQDWEQKFIRANFDYEDKPTDFASTAISWLDKLGVVLSPEERKPEQLLARLIQYFSENQLLVLIDSLERLLTGNEAEGWGDFQDDYWKKFFLNLLSEPSCKSRLILTSQDCPVALFAEDRYASFKTLKVLQGLSGDEQKKLFKIMKLQVDKNPENLSILLRIGKVYEGHPLALRTILGEIKNSPFDGNIQRYWEVYARGEIEGVEKDIEEAQKGQTEGKDDRWQLDRYTKALRLKVRARLANTFERLKKDAFDAYILICTASIYRIPVQKEGWLMQFEGFIEDYLEQECDEERQEKALEQLRDRYLAEESFNYHNKLVLGQHNLIRSITLEEQKNLVKEYSN